MAKKEIKNEEGEEMVQISKIDLKSMMEKIETQSKDIGLLYQIADKGRLAKIKEQDEATLIRKVKISTWPDNGKYIIGWKLTVNRSEIMPGQNRWIEDQQTTVMFEDGSTLDSIPLLEFYRKVAQGKVLADLIKTNQSTDEKGKKTTILEVEFSDGKRLLIDSIFVN